MQQMTFLPELKEFLKRHRLVYTLRKYRYTDRFCHILGVGICERKHVATINRFEGLATWVSRSGFDDIDAWWRKAKSLNPNYVGPFHLYEIAIVNTEYEKDTND